MIPNATRGVLDELRDVLEDEGVELVDSYEVWVLPGHALDLLRDAEFAQRFHHQARTSSELIYARSCMREPDVLDLDEIGNSPTATQIAEAGTRLGKGNTRLLLVSSRQVIALWNPDQAKLAVALSGTVIFGPESTLSEPGFEALLREMAASANPRSGASTQSPQPDDHEAPSPRTHVYDRDQIEEFRQKRFTNLFASGAAPARAA